MGHEFQGEGGGATTQQLLCAVRVLKTLLTAKAALIKVFQLRFISSSTMIPLTPAEAYLEEIQAFS